MKGDAKVIEQLNQALGAEMTAIVQYRTFRVTANFSAKAFWLWGCSR
jgi:bacterioferritin (cytochrome b1)